MKDFNPNMYPINKKAQQVLARIDESLRLFDERDKQPPPQINLFKAHYETLEKALDVATTGKISLATHTYRGIKLLNSGA